MDEKTRVRVMMATSAVVLVGSVLMIVFVAGFDLWTAAMLLVAVTIALVALYVVSKRLRDFRSGMPLEDEMSRTLSARAGYLSFQVSMYLILALAFVFSAFENQEIVVSNAELLFVLVAIMGSVHLTVSAYYNRKGTKALR